MIYTRFGSHVKILEGNLVNGEVKIEHLEDGVVMETYINELKADDGLNEICEAITEAHRANA